jgi:hypothetical protein
MCLELVEFVSFRIWFNVNCMIKEIVCVRNFLRHLITLTRTSAILSLDVCGKSFVRLELKEKLFALSTVSRRWSGTRGSALHTVCERFIYANINKFLSIVFLLYSDGYCCQLFYYV